MDGAAILSSLAARSPSGGSMEDVVGGISTGELTSVSAPQRKITLLTRPPAPPVASNVATVTSGVASIIGGNDANPLISELHRSAVAAAAAAAAAAAGGGGGVGGGGGGGVLNEALQTPGRAARNDYYDTEDPSVNLHDFIINSLQAQKNRVVLLKLEEEFLTYVTDPKRVDPLKLPPWDSYHRMLAHRVAAYFGLEHNVDPVDKSCVVVCKGPQTRVPTNRFSDFLTVDPDSDPAEPKLILKRSSRDAVVLDKSYEALSVLPPDVKTFEEREEEYEKTRARIFNQQQGLPGSQSNIAFDLANAPQTPRSSLLPAIMQHRRTVSDTLLFRRPSFLEELKKDGPSSSHSSRSATPLIALLQPGTAGDAGIVGQTMVAAATGSKVTPQHSPQQQKISPRELPVTQVQVNQQQNVMRTQNKFQRQRPSNVPSFPFQPLAGRGVQVFYPHHQQAAAVMADPSWYYNNMMLYQVPPQQFIPAAAVGGANPYGQMIHQPAIFPLNHQYPVSPAGVVAAPAQSPVVSPPISTPRPGFPLRLPMVSSLGGGAVVDGIPPSPPHLPPSVAAAAGGGGGGGGSGVSLVRPVAQVALPNWGSFKFEASPSSSVIQPGGYPVGQPMGGAMLTTGVGGQQGRPFMAGGTAGGGGQLTEHMEQLALDGRRGGDGGGEMRLGQIGEGKKLGMAHELNRNGKAAGAVVNGSFPTGYAMMSAIEAGQQMMSPTQVHHPTAAAAALSQSLQFLPTHIQHPPPHMIPGSPQEAAAALVSPQHVPPPGTPGGVVHFPGAVPNQSPSGPTTPTIGHMGFPNVPGLLPGQQQQSIFSPPTTGGAVTHSPVQILGHTLGTSLFSPPPSSTGHPAAGMFVNSPTAGGKVIGYQAGSPAPVGSGLRFRRYESPKQGGGGGGGAVAGGGGGGQANNESHTQPSGTVLSQVQFIPENAVPPLSQPQQQQQQQQQGGKTGNDAGSKISSGSSSGFQPVQLPPRLASQQGSGGGGGGGGGGSGGGGGASVSPLPQRNVGNRYQNQRHPANRSAQGQGGKTGGGNGNGNGGGGGGNGNGGGGSGGVEPGQYLQLAAKKEPLLPTPPNTQMVKLDTILTCGVPLHVMEIVTIPPDGSQERQQAFQVLRDMGAVDITGGRITKTGEEVLVASFTSPEAAIKALQMQNMPFTLSIPRNNHAKFILALISGQLGETQTTQYHKL